MRKGKCILIGAGDLTVGAINIESRLYGSKGCIFSSLHVQCLALHFEVSIGEGNGNPLQCSYLENPRDRGAWWAAVYGVAQSRTRLK